MPMATQQYRENGEQTMDGVRVAVIGLGLIGGSMSIDIKRRGFASRVTGVDCNPLHAEAALRLGLVDDVSTLSDAVKSADLVVVAVPVDAALRLLPDILEVTTHQAVTDFCSTKRALAERIAAHPRRGRYLGSHPMAGTEHAGPWAAMPNLFEGKVAILCDPEKTDPDVVRQVETLYDALYMRTVRMDAVRHDLLVAYVSHLSHVSAYALALTVLHKERDESRIFNLAGGGFSSAARLAKSGADMWRPIFESNQAPVLEAIDSYIEQLKTFRAAIASGDADRLTAQIEAANRIRRVLR